MASVSSSSQTTFEVRANGAWESMGGINDIQFTCEPKYAYEKWGYFYDNPGQTFDMDVIGEWKENDMDVIDALYKLNPELEYEYGSKDEFRKALIAAGEYAFQKDSFKRLKGLTIGGK